MFFSEVQRVEKNAKLPSASLSRGYLTIFMIGINPQDKKFTLIVSPIAKGFMN